MKITEAKLRKMIRSVISEFVSSATVVGKSKSADTSTATAQSDYTTKKAAAQSTKAAEPKTANGVAKVYYRASRKGGTEYSPTERSSNWTSNPDYESWESDMDTASAEEKSAFDALTSAQREDALRKEPTQKPPTTTGKTGGKKGKKKKDDDE